jgi:hypothetical protein
MNDIRFDLPGAQPPCQPEAVSAVFERNHNACDGRTGLDGFVAPAMQQPKQSLWVGRCQLFRGSRAIPGTIPPINQADKLSSTTAMTVVF